MTDQHAPPAIVARGVFSQKLRIYMFVQGTIVCAMTIVGILVLPLWFAIGPFWIRRYHAALRCDVTERSVVIARGLLFRRELTIPLDKIQDVSLREGPLLSAFGLLHLRIETAGQSQSGPGKSDADLKGLLDARALRDRILHQRDALAHAAPPPAPNDDTRAILSDIRDVLMRIEERMGAIGSIATSTSGSASLTADQTTRQPAP